MSVYAKIKKRLGDFQLDVEIEAGSEVLALLGASGCGKSMTLRCIAGVEKPDEGKIVVDGVTLFDSEGGVNLSPQERRTGLLFQNYALFPNMTVFQNIKTGALRRKKGGNPIDKSVNDIIRTFKLEEHQNHYPKQLSGGQQQRVALARILVSEPHILMLDEPFSALDSHLRFQLEKEVMDVIRDFGRSVILVSHDRDEVFRISDKIAVMYMGRIDSFGEKRELFAHPKTLQTTRLTGCKNISPAEKCGEKCLRAIDWGIRLNTEEPVGDVKYTGIRMRYIKAGEHGSNVFRCRVEQEIENPFSYTIMLKPLDAEPGAAGLICWDLAKDLWRSLKSDEVTVSLPENSVIAMEK
jgi:molybdate transport system ATP-binding protein